MDKCPYCRGTGRTRYWIPRDPAPCLACAGLGRQQDLIPFPVPEPVLDAPDVVVVTDDDGEAD